MNCGDQGRLQRRRKIRAGPEDKHNVDQSKKKSFRHGGGCELKHPC